MYDQVAQNKQVAQNRRRSSVLIAAFTAAIAVVLAVPAYAVGLGVVGVVVAVLVAVLCSVLAARWADVIALRVSRAAPADPDAYPRYHNLVEGLCLASGLPRPDLYVIDDPASNAFAIGRDPAHASIAVTTGLLDKLDRVELEGVLAHELAHVKSYDIRLSTLAVTMVGGASLLSDLSLRRNRRSGAGRPLAGAGAGAAVAVVGVAPRPPGPVTSRLMHLTVGQDREGLADMSAVEMTRYPPGLISALRKLQAESTVVRSGSRAMAHLWIEDPMAQHDDHAGPGRSSRAWGTHIPMVDRIAALDEL